MIIIVNMFLGYFFEKCKIYKTIKKDYKMLKNSKALKNTLLS